MLRVGQRHRLGARGDQADKALARAHRGQMDRLAVEAFGGEQLHRAVGAHNVKRAHLRHHVGGDEDDDAIQARLGGDGLRHHLAEPPQQQTRSARRAHQKSSSFVTGRSVGRPSHAMIRPDGSRSRLRFPPVSPGGFQRV